MHHMGYQGCTVSRTARLTRTSSDLQQLADHLCRSVTYQQGVELTHIVTGSCLILNSVSYFSVPGLIKIGSLSADLHYQMIYV